MHNYQNIPLPSHQAVPEYLQHYRNAKTASDFVAPMASIKSPGSKSFVERFNNVREDRQKEIKAYIINEILRKYEGPDDTVPVDPFFVGRSPVNPFPKKSLLSIEPSVKVPKKFPKELDPNKPFLEVAPADIWGPLFEKIDLPYEPTARERKKYIVGTPRKNFLNFLLGRNNIGPFYNMRDDFVGLSEKEIEAIIQGKGHKDDSSVDPLLLKKSKDKGMFKEYHGLDDGKGNLSEGALMPQSTLSHELGHAATRRGSWMSEIIQDMRNNSPGFLDSIKDTFRPGRRYERGSYYTDIGGEFSTGTYNGIMSSRYMTGRALDTPEEVYGLLTEIENKPSLIRHYRFTPDGGRIFRILYHLKKRNPETAEKFKQAIAFYGAQI